MPLPPVARTSRAASNLQFFNVCVGSLNSRSSGGNINARDFLRHTYVFRACPRPRGGHSEQKKKLCLFVGAGVSKSAGIPLAGEFAELVYENWPSRKNEIDSYIENGNAETKYEACMRALTTQETHELFSQYTRSAGINGAHFGMGSLLYQNWVDRFVTTNFDNLIERTCRVLNVSPSVYDWASLMDEPHLGAITDSRLPKKTVIHLHGHAHGFRMLHKKKELDAQLAKSSNVLRNVFEDRIVIICGYSGINDPLINSISHYLECANTVYWAFLEADSRKQLPSAIANRQGCSVFVMSRRSP